MRRTAAASLLAAIAIAWAPAPVSAWGFDAHKFIMTQVIPLLPPEIRPFFERHQTEIVEHVIDPDLWRVAGWEEEPPRHFLDLDAYGGPPFDALPRDYVDAVQKHGKDVIEKNGLLPWRTAEMYDKLVEAFRQEATYSRDNIRFFSSVLTHYVSDAHVPFHAIVNYDGQLTGQWGIHSRFETELFERYRDTLQVTPKPPASVPPARDAIFDALAASVPLTVPILEADREAVAGREVYDDEYFTMFFSRTRSILERRLAESITLSASLITAAWVEAGRPAVPVDVLRKPRTVRKPSGR